MNESKVTVLLTYDYEMFLGKSGTIDKCMLEPTNEILRILKKNDAYATFFIDVCFLLFLQKNRNLRDFNKISNQIKDIINFGHRIELHIHPHWIDALYDDKIKQWKFTSYRYYKQSSLPNDVLRDIFLSGYDILSKEALKVSKEYKVIAYRAGGWCLEPFDRLKSLFIETEIKIDSSVLPGLKSNNNIASYNYSKVEYREPYFFNDSILENLEDGSFLEIPLSISDSNFFQRLSNKIRISFDKSNAQLWGDGKTIFDEKGNKHIDFQYIASSIKKKSNAVSLDGYPNFNLKSKQERMNKIITVVGHPKLHTNKSFKVLDDISLNKNNNCKNFMQFFLDL